MVFYSLQKAPEGAMRVHRETAKYSRVNVSISPIMVFLLGPGFTACNPKVHSPASKSRGCRCVEGNDTFPPPAGSEKLPVFTGHLE
jgi:hypothetical protein